MFDTTLTNRVKSITMKTLSYLVLTGAYVSLYFLKEVSKMKKAGLVVLFVVFGGAVFAQNVSDFEYFDDIRGIGKVITKYKGSVKDVVIPEKINEVPVTIIDNNAFNYNIQYNNKITSVAIPNSVVFIDSSAFSHNQLTSVVIPNSVKRFSPLAFDSSVKVTRQ